MNGQIIGDRLPVFKNWGSFCDTKYLELMLLEYLIHIFKNNIVYLIYQKTDEINPR